MRVPLLASLGAMACFTPFAHGAVTLADNDLTLNFGMDVQARAQVANASTGTNAAGAGAGSPYDVFRGAPGESNDVDFSMRRARLLMDGAYGTDWKFFMGLNADNFDRNGDNGLSGQAQTGAGAGGQNDSSRNVQLFKAYLRHIWKLDEDDNATLQGGLDYPFFNRAIIGDPWWLFPQQRASGNLMGNCAVGTRFMINGRMFDWGFDIDESMDPGQAATAQAYQTTGDHREGLFYSTRIEYTLFSDSGKKALYHEDYQGKPGHSLMLTADIGYDNSDYGLANDKVNAYCYGFEALYHLNGLSVLVEGRAMHTKESAYDAAGVNNNILSEVFCAQAGYAFPAMGITIEPAIRWQKLNLDSQHDEQASYNSAMTTGNGSAAVANSATTSALPKWLATYGGADAYNSGNVIDIGVNWIFTPYTLLQTAYTRWNGQTGQNGVHPDANIIRAQFQLYF